MARQLVLDTETTGLEPRDGHRVIEIGVIEILGRRVSENRLQRYLDPGRDSDPGALQVHGLTREFLAGKPKFADIVDDLLAWVQDAEVIIHNAPFDLGFLDAELARLGREPFASYCGKVTDSLRLARELHPGKRNSLDALCERYGVSNSHRTLHGALLDAEILAEVYLSMTRGQDSLVIELAPGSPGVEIEVIEAGKVVVLRASEAEIAGHETLLDSIARETGKAPIWRAAAGTAAVLPAA
jgi:DNA polymerase-3 subunit epsilon